MKRLYFLALILSGLSTLASAQPDPERRGERVQALRIAIFTQELQLTPDEAQGFWPIYNDFIDKREGLVQQYRSLKQLDAMSDAEVEEQIKRHFERQQREIDLEKDLVQKLRKVLPLRKIAKLPLAEREFRESLLKKMQEAKERRQERRGVGGRK